LFSLHIEKKEPIIPPFNNKLIGQDFISDSDWSNAAIKDSDDPDIEHIAEISIQKAEEARIQAIKEAASERGIEVVELCEGARMFVKKEESDIKSNEKGSSKENKSGPDITHLVEDFNLKFYDDVKTEKRIVVRKYLHDHVGYVPGIDEYLYVKALIDSSIIKYPKFTDFAKEFPVYENKGRNFSHYFGSKGVLLEELSDTHQIKVDEYIKEIERLLQ